jgi:diaminopimelate epimerase
MPQLESLKISWQQLVHIGAVLVGLASFAFMLQHGMSRLDADVKRIESELRLERQTREKSNIDFAQQLQRMQTEATAERVRQIELLTELRTDVRQMRIVIERLTGGVATPR